jgi:hypothetical protein
VGPFHLPLEGYYRSTTSVYDLLAFFKLYADGYWLFKDLAWVDLPWVGWGGAWDHERWKRYCELPECWASDIAAFLRTLDVEEIKKRFPRGACVHGAKGLVYQTGRYTRTGNRLALVSCDEDGEPCGWGALEIVGPARLYLDATLTHFDFVPDEQGPQGAPR